MVLICVEFVGGKGIKISKNISLEGLDVFILYYFDIYDVFYVIIYMVRIIRSSFVKCYFFRYRNFVVLFGECKIFWCCWVGLFVVFVLV